MPEGLAKGAIETAFLSEFDLETTIKETRDRLIERQCDEGYWVFDLEADATIPAEYILLNHYLGKIDDAVESKLAAYLRAVQGEHGGWPLFYGGDFNMSATVKAYYALKMTGEDIDALHMARARDVVLKHGGAARCNVFTRITLALFEQVPWRALPLIRAEVLFAPKWFPLNIDKVSYWTRTVTVPLLVLATLKPRARNPRRHGIAELFVIPPEEERNYLTNPTGHWLGWIMLVLDRFAHVFEPMIPKFITRSAIARAMSFVKERLNGEDGLGGIFPAMANALMAFDVLGYARDHPDVVTARRAIDGLLVMSDNQGFCQPCVSPVWDTGLAAHAMLEAGLPGDHPALARACAWLVERQILDVRGDWRSKRTNLRPGGWAFQYRNNYYPDVDDTAVIVMALDRAGDGRTYREAIERGAEWVIGMQCRNGGWAAFDADNEYYILEHMPFADHGALLDPPTADVTARCISMLAQLGYEPAHPAVARGLRYLRRKQEKDGSWFGRWGTNYIYGTWSVLLACRVAGEDPDLPYIRKAVAWLKSCQRPDGGWGEDCATYWPERKDAAKASTPSQTAWALLGLMAAGEVESDSVRLGVEYLLAAPREGEIWAEDYFNAVGFPRMFHLHYHGYSAYFPLWALARYHDLTAARTPPLKYGM